MIRTHDVVIVGGGLVGASLAIALEGLPLDVALVGRILTEVVARHEVLRSTVELQSDGTWAQVVHPVVPVPTPVVDLSGREPARQRR